MKNKAVKIGIWATIVPHIFCCGIPMLLAVVGLVAPDVAHFHLLPHWMEPWLFVFSGIMLGVSWWMVSHSCKCDCDCCAAKSHRRQKIIMAIITVIFIVSLVLHIFSHH